jgi:hypothetical protein
LSVNIRLTFEQESVMIDKPTTMKPVRRGRDPRITANHTEVLLRARRDPRVTGNHTEVLLRARRDPRVTANHTEVLLPCPASFTTPTSSSAVDL